MEVTTCTTANRDMVLQVLQNELHEPVHFHPSPTFTCTVGQYSLLRDGSITTPKDELGIFQKLAFLGLCDSPLSENFSFASTLPTSSEGTATVSSATSETSKTVSEAQSTTMSEAQSSTDSAFSYPIKNENGKVLLNLFSIISARGQLLNKALGVKKDVFCVEKELMEGLLKHPPQTVTEFLQALYGKENKYKGLLVSHSFVALTGFDHCCPEEKHIHRQLADKIFHSACTLQWVKPYTRNVRNKKYAYRTWLNAIGMSGPEYEEARTVMLGRLYGQSGQRSIKQGKGEAHE